MEIPLPNCGLLEVSGRKNTLLREKPRNWQALGRTCARKAYGDRTGRYVYLRVNPP